MPFLRKCGGIILTRKSKLTGLRAVPELVRHCRAAQGGFSADGLSGLPRGLSGPVGHQGLVIHNNVVYMAGEKEDAMAEVAFQYNDGYSETIISFANNVHTPEGGMHEEGFKLRMRTPAFRNASSRIRV